MRALTASLLVVGLAAVPAAALAADRKPPPRPGALWQHYPLGTQQLTGTTPTRPAPAQPAPRSAPTSPPATSRVGGKHGDHTSWLAIVLAAAGTVVVVLAGGATFTARSRRRKTERVESFAEPMATIALAAARLEARRRAKGVARQQPARHTIPRTRGRRKAMSDNVDQAANVEQSEKQGADSAQAVGDRVSGVIRAAEEVAEQIRADAREEASQIKAKAKEAHAAAMDEVAEELRAKRAAAEAEAAEIRRTGELYASDQRRSAEAASAKTLAEAETQARAMREAAEQMAMQIETTALRRREELEERTGLVETRLRRFQAGLREISNELSELFGDGQGEPETLPEALDVARQSGKENAEEEAEEGVQAGNNRRN